MINQINEFIRRFGYIAIPIELLDQLKNELESLNDAINVYESKEVNDAERR